MLVIRHALFPQDEKAVLEIFYEYVRSPSVSLEYQNYDAEFASLPGQYGQPDGRLMLAEIDARIAGCVALRKVTDAICEMKRLYVRPGFRQAGAGKQLIECIMIEAKSAGYAEIRLDVLPEFKQARKLYEARGFAVADPVSLNLVPGSLFLGKTL